MNLDDTSTGDLRLQFSKRHLFFVNIIYVVTLKAMKTDIA